MTVAYEWDVEEVAASETVEHEEGEVLEHWHQRSYAEAVEFAAVTQSADTRFEIVLVRDDDDGRSWAYCDDAGGLPVMFEDAYQHKVARVPKRFHTEVSRVLGAIA